jgi:hypothetical protein
MVEKLKNDRSELPDEDLEKQKNSPPQRMSLRRKLGAALAFVSGATSAYQAHHHETERQLLAEYQETGEAINAANANLNENVRLMNEQNAYQDLSDVRNQIIYTTDLENIGLPNASEGRTGIQYILSPDEVTLLLSESVAGVEGSYQLHLSEGAKAQLASLEEIDTIIQSNLDRLRQVNPGLEYAAFWGIPDALSAEEWARIEEITRQDFSLLRAEIDAQIAINRGLAVNDFAEVMAAHPELADITLGITAAQAEMSELTYTIWRQGNIENLPPYLQSAYETLNNELLTLSQMTLPADESFANIQMWLLRDLDRIFEFNEVGQLGELTRNHLGEAVVVDGTLYSFSASSRETIQDLNQQLAVLALELGSEANMKLFISFAATMLAFAMARVNLLTRSRRNFNRADRRASDKMIDGVLKKGQVIVDGLEEKSESAPGIIKGALALKMDAAAKKWNSFKAQILKQRQLQDSANASSVSNRGSEEIAINPLEISRLVDDLRNAETESVSEEVTLSQVQANGSSAGREVKPTSN